MVDALDSKSSIFGCASSSLARATIKYFHIKKVLFFSSSLILIKIIFHNFFYLKYSHHPYVNFFHYTFRIFQEGILYGVILAILMNEKYSYALLKKVTPFLIVPAYIVIIYLLCFESIGRHSSLTANIVYICSSLIVFQAALSRPLSIIIGKRIYNAISYIGIVSYGMYLFHMATNHLLTKFFNFNNFYSFISVWFISTLFVSYISYEFYEKSFIKLKKKFY